MKSILLKETSFSIIANIAKGIGHPHRLELLELVSQGPKSVETLTKEARMSFANTSQHLQRLKNLKLVTAKRQFTTVYYSIADASIPLLIKMLHQTAFNLSADFKHTLSTYQKKTQVKTISMDELANKEYLMIDVRSPEEYRFGHKAGAINIPYTKLRSSMEKLDKSKLIVTYCRGELCRYGGERTYQSRL
ncbi:MAG: metalloregulator ArsR/SmtB family transcription factor [Cyclobacteriaceae bacterium]|nr:metalloregulator ArsR/SmtB family transcription factor [Cyclobacteriaceae bacterium]